MIIYIYIYTTRLYGDYFINPWNIFRISMKTTRIQCTSRQFFFFAAQPGGMMFLGEQPWATFLMRVLFPPGGWQVKGFSLGFPQSWNMSCHPGGDYTPEDERLEPKNHPMEKENHLPKPSSSKIIFHGVLGIFWSIPKVFFLTKKDLLVKTSLLVDTVINLLLK